MPVYNEEPVIDAVVSEVRSDILDELLDAELVIVDDCSTDSTPSLLDAASASDPRVTVVHAEQNRGHGPALTRAISLTNGQWIFHLDSDRQFVAEDFWLLWEERHDADLVLGVRAERQDPAHRLLLTKVVRMAASAMAGRRLEDCNVPFKLFRREVWDDLADDIGEEALAPSIMLAVGAARRGWRIEEVAVRHLPREHSPSTLRLGRLVRFSLRGLRQLTTFRLRLSKDRPTRVTQ